MKILLLAPEPFYQDRGSPIRLRMLLEVLSAKGIDTDVLTYHEGADISLDHIRIYRISGIPFIKGIRIGFSWKKVVCDLTMLLKTLKLLAQKRYDLIHALEESVFIALLMRVFFRIPYVYDMHSLLSTQLVDNHKWPAFLLPCLRYSEKIAVRKADGVIAVCDLVAKEIEKYNPRRVAILQDVSLLPHATNGDGNIDLRQEFGIEGPILMYVGNLEAYQGIDLLLQSFSLASKQESFDAHLVVIGKVDGQRGKYEEECRRLNISSRVHWAGQRPVAELAHLLQQSTALVSPRLSGENTPMKIYSYLHSGRPVLATDLPTHTQVLNSHNAVLAEANPISFAQGMIRLLADRSLRQRLGKAGTQLIEKKYSMEVFSDTVGRFFDSLGPQSRAKEKGLGGERESRKTLSRSAR